MYVLQSKSYLLMYFYFLDISTQDPIDPDWLKGKNVS